MWKRGRERERETEVTKNRDEVRKGERWLNINGNVSTERIQRPGSGTFSNRWYSNKTVLKVLKWYLTIDYGIISGIWQFDKRETSCTLSIFKSDNKVDPVSLSLNRSFSGMNTFII